MRGPNMIDENEHVCVCVCVCILCVPGPRFANVSDLQRATTHCATTQAATWQQEAASKKGEEEMRSGNSRNKEGAGEGELPQLLQMARMKMKGPSNGRVH